MSTSARQKAWAFGPWPDEELRLDNGAWRLDPFTRIVRWVPSPAPKPKRRRGVSPCGTVSAYQRHLYAGEDACDACRNANREARRRQRIAKAAQAFQEDAA